MEVVEEKRIGSRGGVLMDEGRFTRAGVVEDAQNVKPTLLKIRIALGF